MNCSYPKSVRLSSRRQFQRLARHCKRYVGSWIIIECRPNNQCVTKLGITVTRRYGKAHQRNRFKRIVREAFRLCRWRLVAGLDLNIKPRSTSYTANTDQIMEEMLLMIGLNL